MLEVFGNLGRLIRIIFALSLAAFWGYLAYSWSDLGELGPGQPTVIGLTVLAIAAGLSGLVGLMRLLSSPASPSHRELGQTGSITPEQRDMDADAIIARYMARREAEGGIGEVPASSASPPPAERPLFGSKSP